jgi:putative transposase
MTIIKQYKYRLYRSDKRDKYLHHKINIAGLIWNHVLALQKRYYKLMSKSISKSKMQAHIAKLRMGGVSKYKERPAKQYGKKYTFWQELDSQATQEVSDRLYEAWAKFFNKTAGRPRFKKVKKYKSFTLKQSGYKILDDTNVHITGGQNKGKTHKKSTGHIEIDARDYKFKKHRVLEGKIKTVTVKRDTCNQLWVCYVVECELESLKRATTSKSAGFDFGLKTFLTDSNGKSYKSDEFLKQELDRIRVLHRSLSRKQVGSKRYKRAQYALSRAYIRIADKRTDSHYKLADQLCKDLGVATLRFEKG